MPSVHDNYTFTAIKLLGTGSEADVYSCLVKDKTVVLKVLNRSEGSL